MKNDDDVFKNTFSLTCVGVCICKTFKHNCDRNHSKDQQKCFVTLCLIFILHKCDP